MSPSSRLKTGVTQASTGEEPLSRDQARSRLLSPSTSWEAPSDSTKRYLDRQKHRAETQLNLEAAIVRDERGWIALWTREIEIQMRGHRIDDQA